MRRINCFSIVLLLLASAVSTAVVITDDFSTDHNYLVDGTDGTVWDGLAYNDGLAGTQNTVVTVAAATGGGLNMQSSNGNMEGGDDDGMYLYINVPAGGDFVANVFIRGYTYIDYHDVGLIAIVPGTRDYVLARYFDAFGIRNRIRSTNDGITDNNFPSSATISRYMQLEKAGAVFTLRVSFDEGVTYEDVGSVERLDMENEPLRVGLYQCTFVGNTGNVTFDDFSLEFASNIANSPDPKNGETLVPMTTQLTWNAPDDYTPTGYNVYIGTDPNVNGASELGWSGTTIDPASDMAYALSDSTAYYWRVDSIDPNNGGPIVYTGDVWSFETAPPTPVVTKNPVSQTVAAGTTIDLSVTALNATSYEWFRSDDAVVGGDDVSVGTGNPLSVAINGIAEEGWYYCVATGNGTAISGMARVMTKRLVGYWPLDGDLTDAVDTIVPGAPTYDGTAADPNFATGLIGQGYQFFGDGRVVTIAGSNDYYNFYPQGMTVSCWVTGSNAAIWDTVVSKEFEREIGFQNAKGWWLGTTDAGSAVFGIRPSQVGGGSVVAAEWSYIVGVYDPDASRVRIYKDGQLRAQVGASGFNAAGNLAPLIFGAESTDGVVGPSSATLDDVKIYSYALDSTTIAQQYVDQMGGYICVDGVRPTGDLSGDCQVTLDDFAILAQNWLESNRVE